MEDSSDSYLFLAELITASTSVAVWIEWCFSIKGVRYDSHKRDLFLYKKSYTYLVVRIQGLDVFVYIHVYVERVVLYVRSKILLIAWKMKSFFSLSNDDAYEIVSCM